MQCYCCSGKTFASCCEPYLLNKVLPSSCEALMRSRYSAYCLGDSHYLINTLAPTQRKEEREEDIAAFAKSVHFYQLSISLAEQQETEGKVKFTAKFIYDQKQDHITELSHFIYIDRWYYQNGTLDNTMAVKIGRNDPCPCQSGKKFKHCTPHKTSGQRSL